MDSTSKISEVLLYFLPALLVLGGVFLLVRKFLDNEYKIRLLEARSSIQKDMIPLRLNAYERITLYLERISPNNLLVRTHQPGMSPVELQNELLSAIRTEFEHNLSQQIYMSSPAWESVRSAKEEMIRIINASANSIPETGGAFDLSKAIFEIMIKTEKNPPQQSLEFIKSEIRQLLM